MAFDEATIQKVWEKGHVAPGNDPKEWRKDDCTAWMRHNQHGNRKSKYGWEIDHIDPKGGDSLPNLRPLQWENNVAKSDGRGKCVVVSSGTDNINKG